MPTLTSVHQAHSLSADQARRGYPIHLRGVITYSDFHLDWRRIAFFVQDATGSIYAAAPLSSKWPDGAPRPGSLVDVTGVSAAGDFAPIVDQSHIVVLGDSKIPPHAKPVTLTRLLTGVEDGQWVEIEGTVRTVLEIDNNITLEVAMADGMVGATTVRRPGVDYAHLVDSRVRIHGNEGPLFNSSHQLTGCRLFFPGLEAVSILESGPRDIFALPTQPVNGLLRFVPGTAWAHRVHLRGIVSLQWPGKSICIQDGSGGVCAQSLEKGFVPPGSLIDLAGFTTVSGFRPTLENATFQRIPGGGTTESVPVTPEQALKGDHDAELVQIDGHLIGRDLAASDTTLILSSGKFIFRAILPAGLSSSAVTAIPVGSTLRVVGICSVQVDPRLTLEGYGFSQASQFSILLRSPNDIALLQSPSWWTASRIGLALLISLAITLTGFVWVFVLRKRVEQKTRELRESRELYRHMAHHDALTGLPTRNLFQDRLQTALDRARRFHKSIALLMLDLDKFKQINDSFGHAGGDHVLQVTADRIALTVRKTDSVARLGGDEFIILLDDLVNAAQAEQIAAKIVAALSAPIQIGKLQVPVSASVGICTLSDDADADTLLKRVDAAMYRAKASGRKRFQTFTTDMGAATRSRMQLQLALNHALERNEFDLHYQPLINCATGQLNGFEALLRWNSPEFGPVSPGEFIPLAEEGGLILPIGEWVMQQACRQIGLLQRQIDREFDLFVNLSPLQFLDRNLSRLIERTLEESGRPPASFSLEITESNLLEDSLFIRHAIDRIRSLGVKLVLDDFGVGFSTLAYITQFSIDWIKIDQSLVRNCTVDRSSLAVIRAILEMAHGLDMRVVAEGVEARDQHDLLVREGCDAVQGFYVSRPAAAAELPELVRSLEPSELSIEKTPA